MFKAVVFCGFSHSDPEISRLIDDVIYAAENPSKTTIKTPQLCGSSLGKFGPAFYNMQFENNYATNERFAARGDFAPRA